MSEDLKRVYDELLARDGHTLSAATVELLDEDDENGPVVFRDEAGNPVMIMARSVYEQIKASKLP